MRLELWKARTSPYATLIVLIVPLLLLTTVTDLFASSLLVRILTVLFLSMIVVLGLQVFMGNSGILAWAHVGFMGIGAYTAAICSMTPEMKAIAVPQAYPFLLELNVPFWAAILIGAGVAMIVAAVISYPLMRLSDAAAAITSFALLIIIQSVLIHWDRFTNGPRTLFGVEKFTTLWISALCAIVILIGAYFFKESSLGLKLRASREDQYAASAVGINITFVRYISFVLSAAIAGFGGGLWAHYITSFTPGAFYMIETFNVLAMLVVGGPTGISGAVIGTVVVTVAREGIRAIENSINLNHLLPFDVVGLTEVCMSTALIVILILRPQGLFGSTELGWKKRREAIITEEMHAPSTQG
ncbi:MAG: branched-chain amino acid ABC transporter permease [Anaerolineales bacterium]|nr:branched-chain amino acid ABC transporter permease [Anaerolineales bacterium]